MSATQDPASAGAAVRTGLAAAERCRRARHARRQMWRAAPFVAAAAVCAAALSRWAGWPPIVPAGVLALGAAGLWIYRVLQSREVAVSDAAAALIDADAGMHGELRSAGWFASRDTSTAWTELHLSRAAERLRTIRWTELYPAVPARRSQLASAVLILVAIVVALTFPQHVRAGSGTKAAAPAAQGASQNAQTAESPAAGAPMDPELEKALQALLAAAADGRLPTAEAIAANAELRAALAKLGRLSDAELLAALQRALAANPDALTEAATLNMKALAERAKQAVEEGMLSKDEQDALEKLSDEMEMVEPDDAAEPDGSEAASTAGPQKGDAGQPGAGAMDEVSIQFAKSADAGGGSGMLMMSSDSAQPGGPPGAGVGGAGSQEAAASNSSIDAALQHETVEASQDNPGSSEDTDIRRKTEHGNATVAFTHGEAGSFDRTRAAAPPPIPEARRRGVQTYFVRKAQQ